MYSFESCVRYSEIGEDKRMTLNSLLNYFQDCATFHSESIGRGMEVLESIHRIWVLSSWQVCIRRYPRLCEKIEICTWPYAFKGFFGERNFVLKTEEGKILAYANTIWTYLDVEKGRPARISPEDVAAYVVEPALEMDYAPRKIALPSTMEVQEAFQVMPHHLDTNHHVNNAQYVRMAQDYIPDDFTITQMRAEYKKQAVIRDRIIPHINRNEAGDTWVIALCDEAGQAYAVVEFYGHFK